MYNNIAIIEKYKKFLRNYYQDPLPHDDKLLPASNRKRGYIELAIIAKDDETSTEAEESSYHSPNSEIANPTVALSDILKLDKDSKPVKLVLIEGTSGFGKSSLAWQVCHKWAKL